MGVTGHHQLVAVLGEAVEHPRLGRMGQPQPQCGQRIRHSGDGVVAVPVQMRIIDSGGRDPHPADLQLVPSVGHIVPAALGKRRAQILPRQRFPVLALIALVQVFGGVLQPRAEVVVASEDEKSWDREQIPQGLHDRRHRLGVGQVVAGINHQVRLPLRQLAQPGLLEVLAGTHVDITDVQHP
ncbi:Uncharacterised protein [Mycobacteroides abscessus subsp. massiliense]|nr:Uncharacterised protein [Mycobacteroides abscessus subsp. massiliense]